jgi:hypothetical protein
MIGGVLKHLHNLAAVLDLVTVDSCRELPDISPARIGRGNSRGEALVKWCGVSVFLILIQHEANG